MVNNGNSLNCLHSFRRKNKSESHKKVSENKYFCDVVMPFEDTKTVEFNQYHNSDQALFIIYTDIECLIENM